ncbi:MAG TPA: ABC transporter ATP-binding protein [Pyrinomonadaceae bacterium]|nr:ABC transporter ATP-binding protein [Pyrinomonadaceae bacterium]
MPALTAAAPAVPAVEARELSHSYDGRARALDAVSFRVSAGEIFGLLGPNGGGKTTLFRVLSTELVPVSGAAFVFGFDAACQPSEVRRRSGIVFQSQSLDGKLTVRENLRHQGHLYGLRGAALKSRIDETLARFRVADRAGEHVEKLSGGLRRRVEIARAVLHRPRLLLLDEPTTGLDPPSRRDLVEYLRELRDAEGVSVVWTTHALDEAETCDRVAILDAGRLVALDTPAALRSEIGGDIVSAETRDAEGLREKIRERFGVEATVVGSAVRVECERGHEFVARLVEAFPSEVESVTLSRPTLEDVFIRRTGRRFTTPPE